MMEQLCFSYKQMLRIALILLSNFVQVQPKSLGGSVYNRIFLGSHQEFQIEILNFDSLWPGCLSYYYMSALDQKSLSKGNQQKSIFKDFLLSQCLYLVRLVPYTYLYILFANDIFPMLILSQSVLNRHNKLGTTKLTI